VTGGNGAPFDPDCRLCPRLASYLDEVRARHPDYYCRPVPPFGGARSRLLIVGLAPGMHGANRTGRPFTGDHAGILLYRTLYAHGFATSAVSASAGDDLRLLDCRISNAVKCLPPGNKPFPAEIRRCNRYLVQELSMLPQAAVVIALGAVAHVAVLLASGLEPAGRVFSHGAEHALPRERVLLDSYHCSRQNTNTRRLTFAMFDQVFARARHLLDA